MSVAYELYKEAVGGITINGEQKSFKDLPVNIQNAWCSIDTYYTKKRVPETSKVYEEYKTKNKEVKDFTELPDSLKKSWCSIDKQYDKLLKPKEPKQKKEKKVVEKKPKEQKPKKEVKKNSL